MRFIGFIVMLAACGGSVEPSGAAATTVTTTTANVSAVTNDSAIERITDARCAREFSCDNIGAGRVWRDYESCTRDVRLSMRGALLGQICTSGVDERQLSSCLDEIGGTRCASPQGTIVPFRACSNAKLCR